MARMVNVRREVERVIRVLERGGLNGRENGKVLVKKRVFRVRVGEQENESEVAIISFRYFRKMLSYVGHREYLLSTS